MDRISNICASKDLFLIEDSAQAVGQHLMVNMQVLGIGVVSAFILLRLRCLGMAVP